MSSSRPRIWVDTDIALGARRGDVDDGFAVGALLAAGRLGSIDLLGITTVSGNAPAGVAADCARALAAAASCTVRVVRGPEAQPGASDAADALASLPSDCEIVALGPLSNVAAAIALAPRLPQRVSLSVVGGNLSSPGVLPPFWPHEFNLARDRPSSLAVLSAPWRRLAFYPLDVVARLRCSAARLGRISGVGTLGAHIAAGSERWLARTRWRHGSRGFPVWDLPAALAAAGALPVRFEERTFSRVQRRFAGIPFRTLAAVAFDPATAWTAFDALLSSSR